jgi:hypothetical protein
MGRFPSAVLDNAIFYLDRLRDEVMRIRADVSSQEVEGRIGSIRIEACVAPQVEPTAFEREWHRRNLEVIVAQSVFSFDAAIEARRHA